MLDPQAQQLLQLMVERGVPAFNAQTPVEARQAYLMRKGFTQPEPPEVSRCHDHLVDLNSTRIKVREFRPLGVSATQTLPALVYYHGGGWVIGGLDSHDAVCRSLANKSGAAVLSVDYRLAPEHPFPGMGALSSPLRAMLLSDALDDFAASGGGDALARYDI